MALLFEHYALALLRERFKSGVIYQARGYCGRFIADFLLNTPGMKAVLDTKYIPKYDSKAEVDPQYIMQLSGYARDMALLKQLDIDAAEEEEAPVVPCVILYPVLKDKMPKFKYSPKPLKHTLKFFKCPVPVPINN